MTSPINPEASRPKPTTPPQGSSGISTPGRTLSREESPFDPRDPRFCACGAERGHYRWWWSCKDRVTALDAFRDVSAPARGTSDG
jgi:hypothetical protein